MRKTSGKYTVPPEIMAQKPSNINCTVKSMNNGKYFYVYEKITVEDKSKKGKTKETSGKCIGKIEGGSFVPNKTYQKTLNLGGDQSLVQTEEIPVRLSLKYIDLENKDYGQYAVVLSCTNWILVLLQEVFSVEDSRRIYALGIIYFLQRYTPASYIKDVFDQSILSNKWPTLAFSEDVIGDFVHELGTHGRTCGRFYQLLIDSSGEMIAFDGHVILSCSKLNDLADYGNKYAKLGNPQINFMQAYDIENDRPIASRAFDGSLPDKAEVADFIHDNHYENKTYIVDMGFYSEDNLGVYRENNCHFVIPVSDNTVISSAFCTNVTFTDCFKYKKVDELGVIHEDVILYRETSVAELEELAQIMENDKAIRKTQEAIAAAEASTDADGKLKKPRKFYPRKIAKSKWGTDRTIMYRDTDMHDKMVEAFRSQIGKDDKHTIERLEELQDYFGLIILRTDRKDDTAVDTYCRYKKRWRIETNYNHLSNDAQFSGLQTQDYYSAQGYSFLMVIEGLVKSSVAKKIRSSPNVTVQRLSLRECIVKAAHAKLALHNDNLWYVCKVKKSIQLLMREMGADIDSDMERLNKRLY